MPEAGDRTFCRWCCREVQWDETFEIWMIDGAVAACSARPNVEEWDAPMGPDLTVRVTWSPHEPISGDVPRDTDNLQAVEQWLDQIA